MTVVPNLPVAGILTMAVSVVIGVWSVGYVDSPRGGSVLLGLSFLLLLVGGGFGPPLIGFVVGTAAARADSGRRWSRNVLPENVRTRLAGLWPYALALGLAGWLSLWPGVPVLWYLFRFSEPGLVAGLALFSFLMLVATLLAAFAPDSLRGAGTAARANHR